jgi:DNA modification methylase
VGYLVIKASAGQLPLADNSAGLVIATPPYLGARALRRHEYGARHASEYEQLMAGFFSEATRVVRPGGHILLHTNYPSVFRPRKRKSVVFTVQCKRRRGKQPLRALKSVSFRTRHVYFKEFSWPALPVWVYRSIIEKYSRQNDLVVHVFSGSGNGGVAALKLGRRLALVDLHYHRRISRRLRRESAQPGRRRQQSGLRVDLPVCDP